MLRLSFIYNPPLAVIHCKFSNHFRKEMREVKRSLPALKRMDLLSGRFSVSFEHMEWPQVPTEAHAAFFEDLSKLGCKTINMDISNRRFYDAPRARTSVIVVFDPPVLTKLSKITVSECPEQYMAWMLQCIEESRPVTGRLPYMGASSRYIHKTTCTTEFKYSRFIFADHAPS